MPLGDVSEQANIISAYFGGNSTAVPSGFEVALWAGDYYGSGVEFAYPGYARQSITNDLTAWTVDTTLGTSTAEVTFPDPTDAATTDDADRWVLFNASTGAVAAWDFLDETVGFDAAGTMTPLDVVVYNPNQALIDATTP